MPNTIQSIPEARLLLASLRSVGYSEDTAIADLIDNCITAEASIIDILFNIFLDLRYEFPVETIHSIC